MKKLEAYPVYLIYSTASGFAFSMIVTVNLVYQATVVNLNPLELVLVGTTLEVTAFIFEIPTGVVADLYSRRLSVILGVFLVGWGFIIEGLFPTFGAVLLSQVIWGIGITFISGALEAWISDEVGQEKAGAAFFRGSQFSQMGAVGGIMASVVLGSLRINLPVVAGGVIYLFLGIFLGLVMPEEGFKPDRKAFQSSRSTFFPTLGNSLFLVRKSPTLIIILLISAIYGAFSEGFDRLWTPQILNNFSLPRLGTLEPVVWFGVIQVAGMLLSAGLLQFTKKRVDPNSHSQVAVTLLLFTGLIMGAVLLFSFAGNFYLALFSILAIYPLRSAAQPLSISWINQNLSPKVRATVFSINSQADAFGQIAGGPLLGVIAVSFSIRAALGLAALLLIPALFLYGFSSRRKIV